MSKKQILNHSMSHYMNHLKKLHLKNPEGIQKDNVNHSAIMSMHSTYFELNCIDVDTRKLSNPTTRPFGLKPWKIFLLLISCFLIHFGNVSEFEATAYTNTSDIFRIS